MSLKSRKLAVASVAAFAALGASASSSQAAINFNLQATCKYPLVGIQPLDLAVVADIPAAWPLNVPTERFKIDAVATAGGNTSEAIKNLNAYSVDGESNALSSLKFPSGFVQNVLVPLEVAKWSRVGTAIPSPLVLNASGSTPELTLDEEGNTDIFVDGLEVNLSAYDKAGAPIEVKKITTDIDGLPFSDSDGDKYTFDVSCKLIGGSKKLASIAVGGQPPVNVAPTSPGAVTATPGDTSVALSWGAASDSDGTVVGYDVTVDGKTTRVTGTSTTVGSLTANKDYTASVVAVDDDGAKSAAPATKAFKTTGGVVVDTIAPSVPGEVALADSDIGETFLNLKWGASTDTGGSGLKGYRVYNEDQVFDVPAGTLTKRLEGLGADSEYRINITAIDNAGNESEPLELLLITRNGPIVVPNNPPSKTAGVVVDGTTTYDQVKLKWTAATDTDGTVKSYNVYNKGTLVKNVTTTAITVPTTEKTAYGFTVEAIDDDGAKGPLSDVLNVTTPAKPIDNGGGTTNFKYGLTGGAVLKTLTKGTLPLSGDINADLKLADGTFVADLALKNTSGRLTALGFLPVTASVAFVTSGKTTGLLDDGKLTTKSLVRIKLPSVKLFGAIPLAGGNNCQTKSLSTINLASTNNFDPYTGGNIAGTFAISDLNGCGVLNGLVSPLTAGGGNTINLALKYKSST